MYSAGIGSGGNTVQELARQDTKIQTLTSDTEPFATIVNFIAKESVDASSQVRWVGLAGARVQRAAFVGPERRSAARATVLSLPPSFSSDAADSTLRGLHSALRNPHSAILTSRFSLPTPHPTAGWRRSPWLGALLAPEAERAGRGDQLGSGRV